MKLHGLIHPDGHITLHIPGLSLHCNAPGVCQKWIVIEEPDDD